jgi:hypothetical protein
MLCLWFGVGRCTNILLHAEFKKLPYSRDQYPQFPEMMTNNEDYDRTLQDPIDKELNRTNIAVKTSLWRLAHGT